MTLLARPPRPVPAPSAPRTRACIAGPHRSGRRWPMIPAIALDLRRRIRTTSPPPSSRRSSLGCPSSDSNIFPPSFDTSGICSGKAWSLPFPLSLPFVFSLTHYSEPVSSLDTPHGASQSSTFSNYNLPCVLCLSRVDSTPDTSPICPRGLYPLISDQSKQPGTNTRM